MLKSFTQALLVMLVTNIMSANAIAPRQLPQIAFQKIRHVFLSLWYFSHDFLCARLAFQQPENYKFFVFDISVMQ